MKPKREEDSLYDRDIETMKVQLDMANRNVSDVANYVQMLDGRMDSLTEKVDALEKRIPPNVASKTDVQEIVTLRSEQVMEKIEEKKGCAYASKDAHRKQSGWAVVPYAIIVILSLTTGWIGHVTYKLLPERIARQIMTSGADDCWDLHQAALEVLHIGDSHRKGAKRYLKIIRDPENWRALQLINRIHCANSIGIIDDLWQVCDNSEDGYFIHFLDVNEKPRAVIILCGGSGKQSINALFTEPITREKLKKIKTVDITRIQDAVDCFAAYENGTWHQLENNNSKHDKQP